MQVDGFPITEPTRRNRSGRRLETEGGEGFMLDVEEAGEKEGGGGGRRRFREQKRGRGLIARKEEEALTRKGGS